MPCISLNNGLRLNLKKGTLNDEEFRDFLKKLKLTEQTRLLYFPETLKNEKPSTG